MSAIAGSSGGGGGGSGGGDRGNDEKKERERARKGKNFAVAQAYEKLASDPTFLSPSPAEQDNKKIEKKYEYSGGKVAKQIAAQARVEGSGGWARPDQAAAAKKKRDDEERKRGGGAGGAGGAAGAAAAV